MKLYSGIAKCGTCGKELTKAVNVPESELFDAAQSASSRAFCPGHSKNANLDFAWTEQAATLPTPAVAERATDAPPPPVASEPPKLTPDGIALEDLARASVDESIPPAAVEQHVMGKDENGIAVPMMIVGRNPPRADQLG